jgi:hypothetical protein
MKGKFLILPALLAFLIASVAFKPFWGFYAHQKITRLAVFTLPPKLVGFYKKNIEYLTENAVNPDKRRYIVKDEAPKHYIDLDIYPDSVRKKLPGLFWNEAVKIYTEDTLMAYGIVPWQIQKMKYQLTEAFTKKDLKQILRISADLSHYIADANVPLHTTHNYNGQMTNQVGIHAFWESRLPELFSEDYDYFTGSAEYVKNPSKRAWNAVLTANAGLDSVLTFEKQLSSKTPEDKKFTIEERNGITVRNYSREFSGDYHRLLQSQVERQMRASVKMIGDFWYTCWVDAGQPDLGTLPKFTPSEKENEEDKALMKSWFDRLLHVRRESDF